jgi:2-dehydro-3-deoxyglucarate aldolase
MSIRVVGRKMLKKSKDLKNKLKNGKLTLGSWVTIGHPIVAEVMARSGFEWLTVDMEHSAITLDIAQNLIRTIELNGCIPLVRVGENNPFLIKRVMDAGAHGIIVPMVNTKEDAVKAVKSVRYPPEGFRGVGLARAQDYGFDFEGYKKWLEEDSIVIVQIEHIDAVKNLKEILKTKGVDGFIVGPYDISGSMGIPGEFNKPMFKKQIEKIMKIAKETKKIAGFHVIPPDAKEVEKIIKLGYRFVAISLDTLILGTLCKNSINDITIRFRNLK